MLHKQFDRRRAEETARRLREGIEPPPFVIREGLPQKPGDKVIFSTRTEVV